MQQVKTSAAAVWSLVLGILSFLGLGPIGSIPAIICGHVSRSNIRAAGDRLTGEGMALAGLILGYIVTALVLIWFVLAVVVFGIFGDTFREKLVSDLEEIGGDSSYNDSLEKSSHDFLKDLDSDEN